MNVKTPREWLLNARKTLSRAEISRRTGITPAKLHSIEKGREPTVEELAALLTLALKSAPSTPAQTPDQRPVTEPSDGTADLPGEELELVQWADTVPPPDQIGLPEWIGLQRQKWGEVRQEEALGEWTDFGPITDVRDETGSLLAVGGRLYVAPVDVTPILPKTLPELSLELSFRQLSPTQLTVLDGKRRYANSELWTFKRCRRKWWLAYYRGRRLRHEEPTGPKYIGDRIHRALAAHYVPPGVVATDPRDALERLIVEDHTALVNFHHPEPVPVEVEKRFTRDSDLERVMLDGYIKWVEETGADNEYVVVAPEQAVEANLPEVGDVKIIAKLDVRVRRLIDDAVLWLEHKALRNGTPVLTPNGWRPIEDLNIGDTIIAGDGSYTTVTGIYPQGEVDLYKVTFSDGVAIDACGDHLWSVKRRTRSSYEVKTTRDLITDLTTVGRELSYNWSIPMTGVDLDEDRQHIIHPYVIGVWLGDGACHSTTFATGDPEVADLVAKFLAKTGLIVRKYEGPNYTGIQYNIRSVDPHQVGSNLFLNELRDSGLYTADVVTKFVPHEYLWSSRENRLWLLRGLMDTDGCVRTVVRGKGGGQVLFTSASQQLTNDVAFLVRSLGGHALVRSADYQGRYTHNGEVHMCKSVFTVSIRLPHTINPFALSRKATMFERKRHENVRRTIRIIEPSGRDSATCIAVAHPSQLYVTKDMIVTHNTKAEFSTSVKLLPMDEQVLFQTLVETLHAGEGDRVVGALYNLLRRVKRTGTAKPPFYQRVEVHHNKHKVDAMLRRTTGTVRDVEYVRWALDNGEDHQRVAFPTPTSDCAWDCPFVTICPMFDDGSRAEAALDSYFEVGDPYSYYLDRS